MLLYRFVDARFTKTFSTKVIGDISLLFHQSGIDLKSCVKKPDDEEFNDWLAVHVVDFFNRVQILYGTVSEVCTDESCPLMTGTPKYEYLWADGDKFKVNPKVYHTCVNTQ